MERCGVGVYRGDSTRPFRSYLDEYVFRYNNRTNSDGLFMAFLDRVEKVPPPDAAS